LYVEAQPAALCEVVGAETVRVFVADREAKARYAAIFTVSLHLPTVDDVTIFFDLTAHAPLADQVWVPPESVAKRDFVV
jgi:hypothetical protein